MDPNLRESYDGCDGCSTGDCSHVKAEDCIAHLGNEVANLCFEAEQKRRYIHDIETHCDPAGEVETIAKLREDLGAMVIERDKLLDAWGRIKSESTQVLAVVERMQIEFATMQVQLNEWKQLADRYRILLSRNPLSSQGDRDAIDPGPVVSPP